ncbi:MAG: hypothetical protein HRU35_01025 [Rickettsiaceae bacterium]|nr:hypothetical protein [Rickettsiaceae bacterium]
MLNNNRIKIKQIILLLGVTVGLIFVGLLVIGVIRKTAKVDKDGNDLTKLKIEMASASMDPEKMWRNYFETSLKKLAAKFEDRLKLAEDNFLQQKNDWQEQNKQQLLKYNEALMVAKEELSQAKLQIDQLRLGQNNIEIPEDIEQMPDFTIYNFVNKYKFDRPKSSENYIPEGAYISGYLISGIATSTALNAPEEGAVPVVIRITNTGNIAKNFTADVKQCRIMGSAYGDLSSERAIIRAEKMVCTVDDSYITSNIAGIVHGPDGMNGIKGQIVSTSIKHIKNAMLGGIISGLSNSARKGDNMQLIGGNILTPKKQTFTDIASDGALAGTSSAADKIADYYLKRAEKLSPILTVPGGVKVDVIFTKGFYFGELGVQERIKQERVKESTGDDKWSEDY